MHFLGKVNLEFAILFVMFRLILSLNWPFAFLILYQEYLQILIFCVLKYLDLFLNRLWMCKFLPAFSQLSLIFSLILKWFLISYFAFAVEKKLRTTKTLHIKLLSCQQGLWEFQPHSQFLFSFSLLKFLHLSLIRILTLFDLALQLAFKCAY